jgi:PAS domain S-box-containing protein
MKDTDNNVTAYVCVAKDITKLEETERALRQSEERLRIAGKASYDLIYEWVVEKNELTWFGDIDGALGYKPDEITRTTEGFMQLIHPDDRTRLKSVEELRRTSLDPIFYEYRIRHKDGSWRYWGDTALPQLNDDGQPYMWIGVCTDITDRKQAEKKRLFLEKRLYQAQKMEAIGTLAGGIAHDFNNILTAVIGYAELAANKDSKDSSIHSYLQEILAAGIRARDLVKQILTFSRQTDDSLKPIQVKPIIKEVLKLLRASIPSTIEIRQDLKSDPVILANPTGIHQILMNLCTNAAYAMKKDSGILEVSLSETELDSLQYNNTEVLAGTYLKLTVSDTGTGIDPSIIKHIFDPYFTTKEKGEGTGMGLAVVDGIVKKWGGTIRVYSEPGRGSTFNVYLPVEKRKIITNAVAKTGPPGGTERILFVDDEKYVVDMVVYLLESLGYKVVARTSSVEALAIFKVQPYNFDLVITDMTMPNMTGDKLAVEIMKIRPDIPTILCTGFSSMISEEKARALGIRAFITKPILRHELAVKIREALDINIKA